MAGAIFEDALEQLHCFAQGVAAGEWAEDFGAAEAGVGQVAGDVDAGVVVARGDDEIGEGFVVGERWCQSRRPVRAFSASTGPDPRRARNSC